MSILKSILHRWNKDSKSYDTLHPETEVAQITDWHSGIMASLASKTLGTVVDAITTDSVFGKLIKMLLDASGVKYLIDTTGYVCFGSLFGGLIIQWGNVTCNRTKQLNGQNIFEGTFHQPIGIHNVLYIAAAHKGGADSIPMGYVVTAISNTEINMRFGATYSGDTIGGCVLVVGVA